MPSSTSRTQNQHQQQQLQISGFIKDPATLKLLILAGTNIKSSQLSTVAKCTNLIKLDLSSNMLSDVPINFGNFTQLRILYLNDNNIFNIKIQKTTIQYITLFNNPYKNYRKDIVANNDKLMAVDYNIITLKQKLHLCQPLQFTELKWPIVESSSSLQSQEDYLNLLKAEIFVISNLFKKANGIQKIQSHFHAFKTRINYLKVANSLCDQMRYRKSSVLKAVHQWKNFMRKKQKLKRFLELRGKQHLLFNNLDARRQRRSPAVNRIIQNFVRSIRQRLRGREVLQPHLRSYRQFIPISKKMSHICSISTTDKYLQKLYFLKSELHFLNKVFLYSKKLLFNQKQLDFCDNFQKLVKKDKKEYIVFKMKDKDLGQRSFMLDSIRRTISMIVSQKCVDRTHFLYSKKGHRHIGLKNRNKVKIDQKEKASILQKMHNVGSKLNQKYASYDSLISFSISDRNLFQILLRIVRFFNAGNSSTILSNQTAYFQTQVVFQDEQQRPKKQKIYVGLWFFVKRVIAANIIQKFWRRVESKRQSAINVIQTLKQKRATQMIYHWLHGLAFQQRIQMSKFLSYRKAIQKTNDLYIQLDIYMKLPNPINLLKVQKYKFFQHTASQSLYNVLHQGNYVEIIKLFERKWLRVVFPSIQKALQAYKLLLFTSFKFYYNGFHLKLFNYIEAQDHNQLEKYERKVKHLFKINVRVPRQHDMQVDAQRISRKLTIENPEPFFMWAEVGEKGIQTKFEMEKKSVPISIFVYNKHQKPLKINCDIIWLNPSSIYHFKKQVLKSSSFHVTSVRSRTPNKKLSSTEKKDSFILGDDVRLHYMSKIRSVQKRDRRNLQIAPHTTLLLRNHRLRHKGASQHIQVDLLSQTLNIRKK